ncbi:sodium-dependent bicarbonate transport family permease [Evansella halocellulosilytica]|uniref:sodium-dependent bicarbonate transport family permease n=1 Tax=Evansella halocellulosilytica TaxID=2011013 RepID=UPI000BB67A7F|nr:sodium-dependent bicarbonate transport family permease [Evansella halocellulosilytica]
MYDIVLQNLLSPVVLFFVLGIIAALFKSDLKFPNGLSEALSIYLLIAIGIKGGIELSHYDIGTVMKPIMAALFLGMTIPVLSLMVLRIMKMDLHNAIGVAATYGSVSIVTYGAGVSFLDQNGINYEGFMNVLVVLMESPAIFISLLLLRVIQKKPIDRKVVTRQLGITAGNSSIMNGLFDKELIKESLFGKSVLLLIGSLLIGWFVGQDALPTVKPLFIDLYGSILILFLLNMGLIVGQRLPEVRKQGWGILLFGICMPIVGGTFGVMVGSVIGLSLGGSMLLGVLGGSASYIAAPAALRSSVPEANPSIYLGLALGVTFPFNLIVGIPLYYAIAQILQ